MGALGPPGKKIKQDYAVALNLIVDPLLFESYAVGIEGEGGYQKEGSLLKKEKRLFFFVPWHQKTMVGTYYRKYHGNVNDFSIQKSDISAFIRDINTVYPAADISPENVCFYHAGLIPIRPIKGQSNTNFTLRKNTKIIDHAHQDGPKGFISINSTKFTTAAATAKKLIKYLEKSNRDETPTGVKKPQTASTRATENKERPFINHWPVTPDDIRQFIRHEMVFTLGDIIFRRTNLGALGKLTDDRLRLLSQTMGRELGWDETKINQEVNSVKSYFSSLDV